MPSPASRHLVAASPRTHCCSGWAITSSAPCLCLPVASSISPFLVVLDGRRLAVRSISMQIPCIIVVWTPVTRREAGSATGSAPDHFIPLSADTSTSAA